MAKFTTLEVAGFAPSIAGMRNPLKSYGKADSENDIIGPNDYDLAKRLNNAGKEHAKWMRMITVWVDIEAPRYWWSEFDTYKIGTTANSESTMHKLKDEKLDEDSVEWNWGYSEIADNTMRNILFELRSIQSLMNNCEDVETKKIYHRMMKGLLPEAFIQKRTVCLNYQVLQNMYHQRKNHKLPQWNSDFVSWINSLPYSEFITQNYE